MDTFTLATLAGVSVILGATVLRVVIRRRRKAAAWPTPSFEEVMKTDEVLRKLSGADDADRKAERRRVQQQALANRKPDLP
jgi:hypothetical protein